MPIFYLFDWNSKWSLVTKMDTFHKNMKQYIKTLLKIQSGCEMFWPGELVFRVSLLKAWSPGWPSWECQSVWEAWLTWAFLACWKTVSDEDWELHSPLLSLFSLAEVSFALLSNTFRKCCFHQRSKEKKGLDLTHKPLGHSD